LRKILLNKNSALIRSWEKLRDFCEISSIYTLFSLFLRFSVRAETLLELSGKGILPLLSRRSTKFPRKSRRITDLRHRKWRKGNDRL